jgi:hypothetical protein
MFCDTIGFSLYAAAHAVEHFIGIFIEYTNLKAVLHLACHFEINLTSIVDDEIRDSE